MQKLFAAVLLWVTIASHAEADDVVIAMPSQETAHTEALFNATQSAFHELRQNDSYTLLDASDGSVITRIRVPENARYRQPAFVERDLGGQLATRDAFFRAIIQQAPVSAQDTETDVPSVLASIADLRTQDSSAVHVLVLGLALHRDQMLDDVSMLDDQGRIWIPSDGFLTGSLLLSPYGRGDNVEGTLSGVVVHFCALLPAATTQFEFQAVRRFWGHYIALRGGNLATFTSDPTTCVERFEARTSEVANTTPLDLRAEPVMTAVSATGTTSRNEIEREIAFDALSRTHAAERETLEEEIERLRVQNVDYQAEISQLTQQLSTASASSNVFDLAESVGGFGELVTVSTFHEVPHPSVNGLIVETGIRYQRDEYPQYDNSWCYVQRRPRPGAPLIHLTIGNRNNGRPIRWAQANPNELAAISLTSQQFAQARQSCRFPAN